MESIQVRVIAKAVLIAMIMLIVFIPLREKKSPSLF